MHRNRASGGFGWRGDVTYSRHITKNDRIIYDIYDEEIIVLVLKLEDHYKDK